MLHIRCCNYENELADKQMGKVIEILMFGDII